MRLGLLLILILALSGCTVPQPPDDADISGTLNSIRYARDLRTGVCFAMLKSYTYYGYRVISITAVNDSACK